MHDPRNPTPRRLNHPSPGNAFTPAFLDLLDPEDDPPTATEAVAEGPWTVVRVTAPKIPFAEPKGMHLIEAEPWAVVRDGGHPDDEPPAATFLHLHPARLATAALPIAARDGAYRLDREPDPRGFALRQDGRGRRPPAVAPPGVRRRAQPPRRAGAVAAGARRGARGGGGVGAPACRGARGEEVGVSAAVESAWESILERRRRGPRRERPWRRKVYAPALRRDQLKALYYLKRSEGRPMTKLLQEALDRYLEPHGGVEALIERGVAELGERSEKLCRRCGGR